MDIFLGDASASARQKEGGGRCPPSRPDSRTGQPCAEAARVPDATFTDAWLYICFLLNSR